MVVKLYNTPSDNNVIGKELNDEMVLDNVKLKDATDVMNPVLVLKTEDTFNYNYCFVPKFNRYYFVRNIQVTPNHIATITLDIDVLESWKDDILKSKGMINQQQNVNGDYDDGEYKALVTKSATNYDSPVVLDSVENKILVTLGGV